MVQQNGTPFTTPEFTGTIDWQASSDTAELILHGDYDASKLSDLKALFLQHCKSPQLDSASKYITEADFDSNFKSYTSMSPSGIHLGHYKALVLHNNADLSTEEGQAIENKR